MLCPVPPKTRVGSGEDPLMNIEDEAFGADGRLLGRGMYSDVGGRSFPVDSGVTCDSCRVEGRLGLGFSVA